MTEIAIFLQLSIHLFLWFLAGWLSTQNKVYISMKSLHQKPCGFRMGNTCTPMVDACWCMAKPIQYCKVKKKKKALWTFWINSKGMAEFLFKSKCTFLDFPDGTSGNVSRCQFRRHKRPGFDPWVGKIPWSRKWHPTPVILLEISVGKWAYWATVYGVTKRYDWVTDFAACSVLIFLLIPTDLKTTRDSISDHFEINWESERNEHQSEKQKISLDSWLQHVQPALCKNYFQSCVITSKILISCLISYLWESHWHHESDMHDIRFLLTAIGTGGIWFTEGYHSQSSSVKSRRDLLSFSICFFLAIVFIPMQSTRLWNYLNYMLIISHIYHLIFTLSIPTGS